MQYYSDFFWEKHAWEKEDRHLIGLYQAPFQRPFQELPSGPGLYVIRGPRQVGKSCWLKTILQQSDPQNTFYLSCENVFDYKELAEIFKAIKQRKIILLDEITFVEQWWRAVKHILDQDPQLRIIITGSHAFDIRKGMDQMPGRWGNGGEFELLPMDLFEFSQMRRQAKWPTLTREKELELYFQVGGFPMSLIESGPHGQKPQQSFETYRRWLIGDLMKIGKQEVYLKELLSQIALTTTSTISLQKLAQRTQIGSHNTAQDYVELLEACFALGTLYAMDPNDGTPRFRKEKKFYFRDPLIYWIALEWAGVPAPTQALDQIAELVAYEHLRRRYQRFGYYSDRSGEVDFFAPKKWAIEVKWKTLPEGLSKSFRQLNLAQKIIWTKSNFINEWPEN